MANQNPLKGVRVLDLSRLIPGPFCTRILGDFGAEVVKIEAPGREDYINDFGPFLSEKTSFWGLRLNRGKKRVVIDFFSKEGAELLLELAVQADILIHSFRPGVMESLGLSSKAFHKKNPQLIYLSLIGYGKRTGLTKKAGHDINFMATSGLLSLFSLSENQNLPELPFADFVAGGLMSAVSLLAHLYQQERKNISLELSLTDQLVYLLQFFIEQQNQKQFSLLNGQLPRYSLYKTKDGVPIVLGALETKFWHAFLDAVELSEFKNIKNTDRENEKIKKSLKKLFCSKDSRYWRSFSKKYDCCLSLVSSSQDLIDLGLLKKTKVMCGKKSFSILESAAWSSSSKDYHSESKHTVSFLKKNGVTSDRLKRLRSEGVIV